MKNIFRLGVDPGLTGAIALLQDGNLIDVWDMPAMTAPNGKGKFVSPQFLEYIMREIMAILEGYENPQITANIEQVSAMPRQGVSSMFKFGRCLGVIEGAIAANGIPITYITPQKWKKKFGLIGKDKDASRQLCIQKFPDRLELFKHKKHNGRSDAVLIGMFE